MTKELSNEQLSKEVAKIFGWEIISVLDEFSNSGALYPTMYVYIDVPPNEFDENIHKFICSVDSWNPCKNKNQLKYIFNFVENKNFISEFIKKLEEKRFEYLEKEHVFEDWTCPQFSFSWFLLTCDPKFIVEAFYDLFKK